MSLISASDLDKQTFEGFRLPGEWGKFLGYLEPKTTGFIWGTKGSGKSTWSLDLAKMLAQHFGDEAVIYFSPEEGISRTMQDKIQRVKATRPNLYISDWYGLEHLKSLVMQKKAKAAFLDSAQMSRLSAREMEELHAWAKNQPIQLWIVNHATKDGKYKGSSMYAHMVDIELQVENGTVYNEKNRCGGEGSMTIDFGTIPKKHNKDRRNRNRVNPVPVPFTISLADLDKKHKIRNASRLNKLVDYELGCVVRANRSGGEQPQKLSFRYTRMIRKGEKVSVLEILIDNTITDSACTKDFLSAWKQLLKRNGNLIIEIADQNHAKTVLGAIEYSKQEKSHAKKGEAKPDLTEKFAEAGAKAGEKKKAKSEENVVPVQEKPKAVPEIPSQSKSPKTIKSKNDLIDHHVYVWNTSTNPIALVYSKISNTFWAGKHPVRNMKLANLAEPTAADQQKVNEAIEKYFKKELWETHPQYKKGSTQAPTPSQPTKTKPTKPVKTKPKQDFKAFDDGIAAMKKMLTDALAS